MSKLAGKVAVVTGASKGIGAGVAKALASAGAAVIVNYAGSKEGADRVVAEIAAAGGNAAAVQGDVSKIADVERIFAETKRLYGRLDVLVNNAGVYDFAPIEQITEAHFHRLFNINVLGLLFATQEAVKLFGEDGGSIINISSVVSRLTPPGLAVYSATKGAVDAITGTLSKELGPRKIRVNAINPGIVETEGTQAGGMLGGDMEKAMVTQTPLGRLGQPHGYSPDRGLPGIGGCGMADRRNDHRLGRHALAPNSEVGGWTETRPVSLGLLPSGPDPVGEWNVHRQPPAIDMDQPGGFRNVRLAGGAKPSQGTACPTRPRCPPGPCRPTSRRSSPRTASGRTRAGIRCC